MATAPKAPTIRAQVSDEEWALRVDLAAAYRLVALEGWDDLIFTHLSVRVPGPEHHFLINPYDRLFDEITASSLVKIDMDGKPVLPADGFVNAAGFVIHSAIHGARDDARAVVHLHTPHGMAVSAMADGLMPHTQTAMIAGADLAYHHYEGVATDLDERERLVTDLGAANFMILRNHGTLTVGETVGQAYLRMHFLERACQAQIHMLAAGRDNLNAPPQGTPDKVREQASPATLAMGADLLAWPALKRRLDRIDAGYRE